MISRPSIGMSNLIKLVLLISIAFCEIICKYFLFSSSWSFALAYSGMSTSGMELVKSLVSSSSCKLVFCGIWASSLEASHQILFQLTSWASLHLPTGCIDTTGMLLPILYGTFLQLGQESSGATGSCGQHCARYAVE